MYAPLPCSWLVKHHWFLLPLKSARSTSSLVSERSCMVDRSNLQDEIVPSACPVLSADRAPEQPCLCWLWMNVEVETTLRQLQFLCAVFSAWISLGRVDSTHAAFRARNHCILNDCWLWAKTWGWTCLAECLSVLCIQSPLTSLGSVVLASVH